MHATHFAVRRVLTNRVTDETYFFFRREAVDRFLVFAADFLVGFLAALAVIFLAAFFAGFFTAFFFAGFASFLAFFAGLRAGFFAGLAAAPASIASASLAEPVTASASPCDGSSIIPGAANETGAS